MPDADTASPTRHAFGADEWRRQAVRDLAAAQHLLGGGFLPPAVALAHLAVEKALKALYRAQADATPARRPRRPLRADPARDARPGVAGHGDGPDAARRPARRPARGSTRPAASSRFTADGLLDAPLATDRAAARAHVAAAADLLDWGEDHMP